jgi:hypothetical protein
MLTFRAGCAACWHTVGMTTMAADGIRRAAAGETSLEEVLHAAPFSVLPTPHDALRP